VPSERVQLGDRLGDLGAHASVGLVRPPYLLHDAFGRQVLEERSTAFQPSEVGAQAHDYPRPALGDVASQISPERSRARGAEDVTGGPGLGAVIVGIRRKPLARAG